MQGAGRQALGPVAPLVSWNDDMSSCTSLLLNSRNTLGIGIMLTVLSCLVNPAGFLKWLWCKDPAIFCNCFNYSTITIKLNTCTSTLSSAIVSSILL